MVYGRLTRDGVRSILEAVRRADSAPAGAAPLRAGGPQPQAGGAAGTQDCPPARREDPAAGHRRVHEGRRVRRAEEGTLPGPGQGRGRDHAGNPARPRRGRVPRGAQGAGGLRRVRGLRSLRRLQRRRGRAGHLQGPHHHGGGAAPPPGRHDHLRAGHRRSQGLHLRARGVRPVHRAAGAGTSGTRRRTGSWVATSWAAASPSTSSCAWARAPTSAARS